MKNTTHYFVYVGHGTQTKNKLQEEFKEFLRLLSGTLIDTVYLEHFTQHIVEKAKELNQKHKRCESLVVMFKDRLDGSGFMIVGFHFLHFQLLNARLNTPF